MRCLHTWNILVGIPADNQVRIEKADHGSKQGEDYCHQ